MQTLPMATREQVMDIKTVAVIFSILLVHVAGETVVNFTLEEGQPSTTLVGNIATASGLQSNMSEVDFQSLQYNFLDQTKMQSLFTINSENGKLFTAVVIDRELECGFTEICHLTFDVAAHFSSVGSSVFEIISVKIILLDKNDNIPSFSSSTVNLQVSESAIVGSPLVLEEATDLDSTAGNGIHHYEMVANDTPFSFVATKNSDDGFDLKLTLTRSLDRETVDNYEVKILAVDGGVSPNTGTFTVHIEVMDYNDNPPVFDKNRYEVTVREDVSMGTTIIKLNATDDDINENGKISYRMNPRQANFEEVNSLFAVNSLTGEITVKGTIVYEAKKVYEIYVEAMDSGLQPKVTETLVLVSVLDVGNNAPKIRVTFLPPGSIGMVNVSESASLGTVIAHVTVHDTDSGPNGIVTCSISNSNFALQTVPSKGYIITVVKPLDRENEESQNISVTCQDQGTPVLFNSTHFLVQVLDFNDNAPDFHRSVYLSSISENNAVGDVITQVAAKDRDVGQNAHLRYYLGNDTDGEFRINANTGVITANISFDRENTSNYHFTVLAVDDGSPALTGSTSVVVAILDQNDNAPTFKIPMFQFFVLENLPADLKVGTLSAIDTDTGDNKKILYYMAQKNQHNIPFEVFPDGSIKTKKSLDREKESKYEFEILAVDQGNSKLTSSATVTVYVADDNDNKPVIIFPGKQNETVRVSRHAKVGSVITHIQAFDADEEGPNSQLKFSIVGGNEFDMFSIGENSGSIFLKRSYSVESETPFRIRVNVTDMNRQKTQFTEQDIFIVLTYANKTTYAITVSGSRNIIISVTVVALTIILSAVIITVICILRRNDKKMKQLKTSDIEHTKYSLPPPMIATEKLSSTAMSNVSVSNDTSSPKKKKEVSFNFEDDMDNMELYNSTRTSAYPSSYPDPMIDNSEKPNSNFKPLTLQHVMLATQANHREKQQQKIPPPGDNFSDSSGELTNSDSGKGGSDLDLSNQVNRPDYMKTFRGNINSRSLNSTPKKSSKRQKHFNSIDLCEDNSHDSSSQPHQQGYFPSYV